MELIQIVIILLLLWLILTTTKIIYPEPVYSVYTPWYIGTGGGADWSGNYVRTRFGSRGHFGGGGRFGGGGHGRH